MMNYLFIFILPYLMINLFKPTKSLENLFYLLFVIYLTIIVGFRFEMGLDWGNYINEFSDRNIRFADNNNFQFYLKNLFSGNIFILRNIEPLYLLTLKLSFLSFENIILFNVLNSLIAIGCLSFFCFKLDNKWFGLAISVSFVIFYGMDIVRQFTSLGFIFLMIYNLSNKNYSYSIICWILALGFHFSSIIFILLIFYTVFAKSRAQLNLISLCLLMIFLVFVLSQSHNIIETNFVLSTDSIYDGYQSKGLFVRLILCIITLVIFLYFKNYFITSRYFQILNWYSFLIVFCIILFILEYSTTVVDRLIVYSLPYQIIVHSHMVYNTDLKKIKNFYLFSISSMYLIFALGWLFISEDNFRVYVPYKSVIWENYQNSPSVICNSLFKCQLEGGGYNIKYE